MPSDIPHQVREQARLVLGKEKIAGQKRIGKQKTGLGLGMAPINGLNILLTIAALSSTAAAGTGDDFSNNLFSDLAPILALFGEQVAKQFMSQSLGWADNILFAMAPLGIITAIVGAIRVGGPVWLKAIIGRARENASVAEVELMSSTSHDVCELWNGQAIVRMMGSPQILELIHIRGNDGASCELFTLEEARAKGLLTTKNSRFAERPARIASLQSSPDTEAGTQSPTSDPAEVKDTSEPHSSKSSPNIALNLRPQKNRNELYSVAVVATALQLGVLVYSGLAVYQWDTKKGDQRVERYAYPLTALGTVILVTGMLICSFVVERRTKEEIWVQKEKTKSGQGLQIMWLQRGQAVSDQLFDSFALLAMDERDSILTSRLDQMPDPGPIGTHCALAVSHAKTQGDPWTDAPAPKPPAPSGFFKTLVVAGTLTSICGFVVQFTGLRGLHWSATIAQLVATLVVTALRAWVRRGLSHRPSTQKIPQGYELDWLATRFARNSEDLWRGSKDYGRRNSLDGFWNEKCWDWSVVPGVIVSDHIVREPSEGSEAHKVVKVREHLGNLCGWVGVAWDPAISVAKAIDVVMNTLPSSSGLLSFAWSMNGEVGGKIQRIFFTVTRDEKSGWKSNAAEIEAALSLWLYTTRGKDHFGQGGAALRKPNIRLIGPYERFLHRDLSWFAGECLHRVSVVEEVKPTDSVRDFTETERASTAKEIESEMVVGFDVLDSLFLPGSFPVSRTFEVRELGAEFTNDLSSKSSAPDQPEPQHAKERTSALIPINTAVKRPLPTRYSLAVVSDDPRETLLAQDMFSAFMWAVANKMEPIDGTSTVHQTKGQVVDGVKGWQSFRLQNSKLVDMAHDVQRAGLGSLEDVYLSIVPPLSLKQKLPTAQCVVEYARSVASSHEAVGHWEDARDTYLWLFRTLTAPGSADLVAIKATAVLYEFSRVVDDAVELWIKQHRDPAAISRLEDIKSALSKELGGADVAIIGDLEKLYQIQCRFGGGHVGVLTQEGSALQKGFSGFRGATPLHRDVLRQRGSAHGTKRYLNAKDIYDLAPLHYAVMKGYPDVARKLLVHGADPDIQDICGCSPLHYAAMVREARIVEAILETGRSDPKLQDLAGWSPLHYMAMHYVAVQGKFSVGWMLLGEGAELGTRARDGTTPLHCAVKANNIGTAKWLIEAGADVEALDSSRRTPLHWAAYRGGYPMVEILKGRGANQTARDDNGRIPLHLAAVNGTMSALAQLGSETSKDAKDWRGLTPLHLAAVAGKEVAVTKLLEIRVNTEEKDAGARTALSRAAGCGHEAVVRLLVEGGAEVGPRDESGRTPILWAAEHGHHEVVMLLLDSGAKLEATDVSHRTPLLWAAKSGSEAAVRLLVEKGANMEPRDDTCDRTPLSWAAGNGHEAVVRLLIEKGAEKDALSRGKKGRNLTPLLWAAGNGYEAVVRLLIKEGVAIESRDVSGQTPLSWAARNGHEAVVKLLIEEGAEIESKDTNGQTPLLWAAKRGKKAAVRQLVESGANIKSKDNQGLNALSLAASSGSTASLVLLIEKGVAVESNDIHAQTALSWAARAGDEAAVRLLAERGANIESQDSDGRTPLSLAAEYGHGMAMAQLVDSGANIESKDKNGRTPLSWATWKVGVSKLLVDKGAKLESGDKTGRTPLSWAAEDGHEARLKLLINKGAEVESMDNDDQTPLSWAARRGSEGTARLLIESGAKPGSRNKDGRTPLDLAVQGGHEAVAALLVHHAT